MMSKCRVSPRLNIFLNALDHWMKDGRIGKHKRSYVIAWLMTHLEGVM